MSIFIRLEKERVRGKTLKVSKLDVMSNLPGSEEGI